MNISYQGLGLLKHVVSYNGQHELNADGKEIPSPRKLNGEESAQRRFFIREVERVSKIVQPKLDEIVKTYNDLVDAKKKEIKMRDPGNDEAGMTALLGKDTELQVVFSDVSEKSRSITSEKQEVTLSEKTVAFLKKYFVKFGNDSGFMMGDDETIEELNGIFGL